MKNIIFPENREIPAEEQEYIRRCLVPSRSEVDVLKKLPSQEANMFFDISNMFWDHLTYGLTPKGFGTLSEKVGSFITRAKLNDITPDRKVPTALTYKLLNEFNARFAPSWVYRDGSLKPTNPNSDEEPYLYLAIPHKTGFGQDGFLGKATFVSNPGDIFAMLEQHIRANGYMCHWYEKGKTMDGCIGPNDSTKIYFRGEKLDRRYSPFSKKIDGAATITIQARTETEVNELFERVRVVSRVQK